MAAESTLAVVAALLGNAALVIPQGHRDRRHVESAFRDLPSDAVADAVRRLEARITEVLDGRTSLIIVEPRRRDVRRRGGDDRRPSSMMMVPTLPPRYKTPVVP